MPSSTTLPSMRAGTTSIWLLNSSSPSSRTPCTPTMDRMVEMEPNLCSNRNANSKPTTSRATSQREFREQIRDKLWAELGAVAEDVAGAGARARTSGGSRGAWSGSQRREGRQGETSARPG